MPSTPGAAYDQQRTGDATGHWRSGRHVGLTALSGLSPSDNASGYCSAAGSARTTYRDAHLSADINNVAHRALRFAAGRTYALCLTVLYIALLRRGAHARIGAATTLPLPASLLFSHLADCYALFCIAPAAMARTYRVGDALSTPCHLPREHGAGWRRAIASSITLLPDLLYAMPFFSYLEIIAGEPPRRGFNLAALPSTYYTLHAETALPAPTRSISTMPLPHS